MTLLVADRVLETCNAPGTGSVTLLGAQTGYQAFSSAIGNGNTTYYTISDQAGSNWEVGLGTYTLGSNSLTRTTVLASSNGGSTVNFSAGVQNVFVTYPAEKSVTLDAASSISAGSMLYGDGTTSYTSLAIGTSGYLLQSNGTAPTWVAQSTLSIGTATNLAGGATGSVPYQSGSGTTTFLGIGTSGYVLQSNGTAPTWVAQSTITTGTATNLAGGIASQIPYQSAAGTTAFIANGTSGQVLTSNGTSAPSWQAIPASGVTTFSAGTTGLTPNTATSGGVTLGGTLATTNGGTGLTSFTANGVFYASSTSALAQSANLTFNGTTLTSTGFSGPLNGTVGATTPAAGTFTVGTFNGQGYSPNQNLTDAATIAWDTNSGQVATFTFVSSNRTMGAPTNLVNGGFYALAVIQNAGGNTLTWNSVFKWVSGSAPTLSTTAGAKDYFVFRSDGTNLYQQGAALGVA